MDDISMVDPEIPKVRCSSSKPNNAGPSTLALMEVDSSPNDLWHSIFTISEIANLLHKLPNNKGLKDFLEFNNSWAKMCGEKREVALIVEKRRGQWFRSQKQCKRFIKYSEFHVL